MKRMASVTIMIADARMTNMTGTMSRKMISSRPDNRLKKEGIRELSILWKSLFIVSPVPVDSGYSPTPRGQSCDLSVP